MIVTTTRCVPITGDGGRSWFLIQWALFIFQCPYSWQNTLQKSFLSFILHIFLFRAVTTYSHCTFDTILHFMFAIWNNLRSSVFYNYFCEPLAMTIDSHVSTINSVALNLTQSNLNCILLFALTQYKDCSTHSFNTRFTLELLLPTHVALSAPSCNSFGYLN